MNIQELNNINRQHMISETRNYAKNRCSKVSLYSKEIKS